MGRSLEGRVALVTGASEGGAGRAIAGRFAAEGAKVVITAPNEDGLLEMRALIGDVGSTGLVIPADFGDPHGPRTTLVERTEAEFGRSTSSSTTRWPRSCSRSRRGRSNSSSSPSR
jgi:3-oxoacyl-[acyl-carrier protein] reductase